MRREAMVTALVRGTKVGETVAAAAIERARSDGVKEAQLHQQAALLCLHYRRAGRLSERPDFTEAVALKPGMTELRASQAVGEAAIRGLCQRMGEAASGITDLASFVAWKRAHWPAIMAAHTLTYGKAPKDRRR